MDFIAFEKLIPKLKKITLPGEKAHQKLLPVYRQQEFKKNDFQKITPRKSAVLCVFYPTENGKTSFVLILRNTYKGIHSNQIAFPGGKFENRDQDLWNTALRETQEEIGISKNEIRLIKQLTQIYISSSNFSVLPFMGMLHSTPVLTPQEKEVTSILEIDIDNILDDSCLTREIINTSYIKNVEVPAFVLNNHVVWGATAMILNEIKEVLQRLP